MDITSDGIDDVFIGGRYAEFYAINGSTGAQIWEFFPHSPTVSVDSGWYNFYNPQFIPDQNSDGMPDILVANGGNHSAPPWDTLRPVGMLLVLDAMTGNVLAKDTMPDGEETYCSPVVVDYAGTLHIFYGSGGENDKGSLWRTTLPDLMADNLESSIQLASDPSLGFIAPSSIADMNDDGWMDIINQAYDGTIRCFDGATNNLLWEVVNPGTESSSGPTIGNFIGDATPDVFNVVYKGAAPSFTEFYQIMIDGATGAVAWKDSIGDMHYGSSSAVDLDGNGRDEAIISVNYNTGHFTHQILSIDFQNDVVTPMYAAEGGVNLAATPMIEDIDNNGLLDFIFAFRADSLNPMGQNGFHVKCIEGTNGIPGVGVAWGNYQGTNKDGHYNYQGFNCGTLTVSSTFNNISCNGFADANVSLTPTSGTPPYTYLWSNGEITSSVDSLDVGSYTVIVTDATGCFTELSVTTFDPYVITFGAIQAPVCPDDSTGKATVNSSGCPCMFSTCVFDWDSGDSIKTATMLNSGWEIVTITHMDGCIVVDSVFIPESDPVLDSLVTGGIDCADDPFGSSFIQLYFNDTVHTEVTWSTGDSTDYVDSLNAGWYYYDLVDTMRMCYYSDSVEMIAPPLLDVNITGYWNDSIGTCEGGAVALANGGVSPYTYTWDDILATVNDTVNGLCAGIYIVTVVDSHGCMTTDSVEILNTLSIDEIEMNVLYYPNPTQNHIVINVVDSKLVGNAFKVTDHAGRIIYEGILESQQQLVDFTSYADGIYFITVADLNQVMRVIKQ